MCNSNQNSCLRGCQKCFGWVPVIFILVVVGWSYYAYVYSLCIVQVNLIIAKVFFLIFYHILLILFLWSYIKGIAVRPIKPPNQFRLSASEWASLSDSSRTGLDRNSILEKIVLERNLPVYLAGHDGNIRVCSECKIIKPDRAHHCSTCGTCLLKMDHHCPWTNNCVGYHNHKYFIVFLAWGTIYCLYIVCTSAAYFVDFWTPGQDLNVHRFQVLFLFIVAIMFGLCQLALGGYHLYLVGVNQSTLETFQHPRLRGGQADTHLFDLGIKENFYDTFGSRFIWAILPVFTTPGDGFNWRFRDSYCGHNNNNIEFGVGSPSPLSPKTT